MIFDFGLINSSGQRMDLNSVQTGLLNGVSGLGGKIENTYFQASNKWILINSKSQQPALTGNIIFHGSDAFTAEKQLTTFLRGSRNLKMQVTTPVTERFIDVDIVSYTFDLLSNRTISCAVEFLAKSLWYSSEINRAQIVQTSGARTRYAYMFPSMFDPYSDGYVTVNNNGSVESGFQLEFYGPVVNPECDIQCDGESVGSVTITGSAAAGQRIIYSSVDGNIYAFLGSDAAIESFKATRDTAGLTNLVPGLSILNANFFKLKVGENRIHVTADNPLTQPVIVTTYKYYRVV